MEEVLIQKAVKTTIQIFYDKGFFDNYPNANKVLKAHFFELTNSVFNISDENNKFSITTPSHWNSEDVEELINKLIEILEL